METSIRDVLTDKKAPNGPLFGTGGKLADEIIKIPGNDYTNRRAGLYALLMQVFRGDRGCPANLEKLIVQAVSARLANETPEVTYHWVERVRQAIAYQNKNPDQIKSLEADQVFQDLLADADLARVHFIVSCRTIEEQGAKGKAKFLQSILIRRLNLYDSALVDVEPATRFVFCLPTERSAQFFWLGLLRIVTGENPVGKALTKEIAKSRFKYLSESEKLQVWQVPECMCGAPLVVFNPQDGPTAYSFCFHKNDRASIMKWDDDSIIQWNMLVYTPFILDSQDKLKKRRLGWNEYGTHEQ